MNNMIEIEIADIAFGGSGIGRVGGFVYFVPGTIPGERVLAEKVNVKKKYAVAGLVEVLQSSPKRINPVCPLARAPFNKKEAKAKPFFCPGCSYQHIKYEEELKIKNLQVENFLGRGLKKELNLILKEPAAAPVPLNYRNKIVLHVSSNERQIKLGYFAEDNSSILDIKSCPLANPAINELLPKFRKDCSERLNNRDEVTFRHTEDNGALFWINSPDKKELWLEEKTALGSFSVPCGSFFQVNPQATDILVLKIVELVKQMNPVYLIDLYCGCGLFGITAAKTIGCQVTGVDNDTLSIKAAKYNAQKQKVGDQCRFFADSVEKFLEQFENKIPAKETVLILDPPRAGISGILRELAVSAKFQWIIYTSCSPDTMTRDLTFFCERGYELISAEIVDMFPRTSHFESLVCLRHNG